MQMITLIPASAASKIASAAKAGGTNKMLVSAPACLHGVLHRIEHRTVEVALPPLSRRHAPNYVGAVLDHLAGVEGPFGACESLDDDAGILVDENAHGVG